MQDILNKTERVLQLRNYSPKTRKAYLHYIKEYIIFSKEKGIKNKQKAIEEFLLDKHNRGQSSQTVNLALNAVKFFYSKVLKSLQKIDLKFAKRNKKLPVVLSRAEIEKLISRKAKTTPLSGVDEPIQINHSPKASVQSETENHPANGVGIYYCY